MKESLVYLMLAVSIFIAMPRAAAQEITDPE
jgi:hypothetical protein